MADIIMNEFKPKLHSNRFLVHMPNSDIPSYMIKSVEISSVLTIGRMLQETDTLQSAMRYAYTGDDIKVSILSERGDIIETLVFTNPELIGNKLGVFDWAEENMFIAYHQFVFDDIVGA